MAERVPQASMVRVVLVDAREERRGVLRHVLDGAEALVVGEADGRATALDAIEDCQPDVVVVDVRMPVVEGLQTIRDLRRAHAGLGIVACAFDLDAAVVQQVLAEGAHRYLAKPVHREDLLAALEAVRPEPIGGSGRARAPSVPHPLGTLGCLAGPHGLEHGRPLLPVTDR